MKKVRITLKEGSAGKKFWLFPSAEALYMWAFALEKSEQLQVDGLEEVLLEPGGFIEAELQGFEYSYEASMKFKRLDLVRLGRAHRPMNSSGLLVTTHSGWVLGTLLPMKAFSDQDIDVQVVSAADSRIDLGTLFQDDPTPDSVDVEIEEEK